MSKEVKRYDPFGYDGLSALMHEDTFGDYVAAEDYDALIAEREWISVEDRLPEAGRVVFAAVKGHALPVPLRKNGPSPNPNRGAWDYTDGDTCRSAVTHWMPIPAMPALQGEQP